ncbi:hypothetical protein COU76_03580 [Candidatus Peregrinibacteria bacterium CG10_big_fil_rev_8_21_14_0_10_49_10]|nr:MAG: hypothetical protein COU76_03580 [Candidatus Peregrinibacteria bacterium CG10_big_fil_rev_8_21_14_0_10_49_10]
MPLFRRNASVLLLTGLLCGVALVHGEKVAAQAAQAVTYVTRAEAAQLLLKRSNRVVPDLLNDGTYPDVVNGEPYAKYVLYAAQIHMWSPEGTTQRLRPHKPITRGEYLQMLATVYTLSRNEPHGYKDVPKGRWDAPYAGIAQHYKLFFDLQDLSRLRSDLPVTHEEAAENLYKLFAARPELRAPQHIQLQKVVYSDTDGSRAAGQTPDRDVLHSYTTVISRDQILESLEQKKAEGVSNADIIATQVVALVNAERTKVSLAPLKQNSKLQLSAVKHAKDMSTRGYFSHYTPEGVSFVDRIKASGYTDVDPIACGCTQVLTAPNSTDNRQDTGPSYVQYSQDVCQCRPHFALGENLAKGQLTPEETVRDWMNSPGHRTNLLQPAFTEIGVGIFRDMWVQNFGNFELLLP